MAAESQKTFEQLKKYMTEAPLLAKPSPEVYLYIAVSKQSVNGEFEAKDDIMAKYLRVVKGILTQFDEWCQRHAPIVRQPPERLTSISTPIPFLIWGIDILGPFPVASGHIKFIVVAIDYFTKWIEAKTLAKITTKKISQFFWKNAEIANRIILDGLKKRVKRSRNTWEDELLPILWEYRTTCKLTTEATPFMLAYGDEAVVPLEITHGSPRIEAYEPETNEEGMRLALDLIDEQGDLILRNIEASGVGERGKLSPNWEGLIRSERH
ncbi:uncharacterized protein LOC141673511 [Apium graveolens]|uniref:uncharacterized protein LOC141673511 n=1 Tax=Apium graveolens TaxID=4045 RepID=UPI003D7AB576